ncbi:MAG: DUF2085 domain-containing protein [Coriobacteriia bacterium]|nr:DUF2085 domain-containing protein [Coriobacteriia bacterium]
MHALLQNIIYFFGFGICHQIPGRTLEAGGYLFTVCARDTGTHVGFAATLIVAALQFHLRKIRPSDLPPWPMLVVAGLMFIPMGIDGASSYLGLRETTNLIRFFTGLPAGIAVGILVAPLLSGLHADADPGLKAFRSAPDFIGQVLGAAAVGSLFFLLYPLLGVLSPWVGIIALLAFVISLNLLVLSGIGRIKRPIRRLADWLKPLAVSLLLALVELSLLDLVRFLVFGVNRGSSSPIEQLLRFFALN